MWPLVGYRSPNNSFTVVDFPEPFGPSKPNTSPRRTSKSTLSTARAFGRPQKSLKTLVRPRTATTRSFEVELVSTGLGESAAALMQFRASIRALQDEPPAAALGPRPAD